MNVAILLCLLCFVTYCHGNVSIRAILDKIYTSADKRSDGLLEELAHLLVERQNILKRCKATEDMVQKLTRDLNVTKQSVDQLRLKMANQHTETRNKIISTGKKVNILNNRTEQHSNRIVMMQTDITSIQKTKGLFGYNNGIGFSVRFTPYDRKSFSKGAVVKFDYIISNQGNGYSTTTGKFTCRTPGLYLFLLTVVSDTNWGYAIIVKNKDEINLALTTLEHNTNKKRYESGSTSALLTLKVGDEVWVKSGTHTSYEWHCNFNGLLISE